MGGALDHNIFGNVEKVTVMEKKKKKKLSGGGDATENSSAGEKMGITGGEKIYKMYVLEEDCKSLIIKTLQNRAAA